MPHHGAALLTIIMKACKMTDTELKNADTEVLNFDKWHNLREHFESVGREIERLLGDWKRDRDILHEMIDSNKVERKLAEQVKNFSWMKNYN